MVCREGFSPYEQWAKIFSEVAFLFSSYILRRPQKYEEIFKVLWGLLKVRQIRNGFFKPTFLQKKRTNKFVFTAYRLVFIRFLEESEDTKKTFQN